MIDSTPAGPIPFSFQAKGRLIDFMRQAEEPGLVNLAAGVPGLDSLPQPELQEAFQRGFAADGARMLAYHHPEGDLELRELLAARLRGRGDSAQASEIITMTGCTQGLQVLLSTLLEPGDIVACEAPAYYGLLELLSVARARVLPLPVRGEAGVDLAETAARLEEWRPKVAIICTTLSNPSGATLPPESRAGLVEVCRRTGTQLIEDDIYGELLEGGAPAPLRQWDPAGEVVSYVTSFCKSIAPGLRVGFCIPGPRLHERVATRKCQQDLHSAVVSEVALREFFKMEAMEPHLEGLRARNCRRREIGLAVIEEHFPEGTQVLRPRGGYLLWLTLPRLVDLPHLAAQARARGIAFASGAVFFAGPAEASCLRINCAKATETELATSLAALGALAQSAV